MKHKLQVGFAIPRRDVVIELAARFRNTFKNNKVICIYGGNTKELEGDIICLTTHQLYRFKDYFDLLILDEIDAFPYHGNDVLRALFKRSVKGNYVLMSATPDEKILKEFNKDNNKIVTLFYRHHLKDIPIPQIKIRISIFKYFYLIKKLREYAKKEKPCLVFVPTIEISENLYNLIKIFAKHGYFVNSHSKNREEIIWKFRKREYKFLITTAVLERGVTVKDLQVIIFNSENKIYNDSSLIQISGRVGRVKGAEGGEIIYLCEKKTKYMEKAIEHIKNANESLHSLLQAHQKQ